MVTYLEIVCDIFFTCKHIMLKILQNSYDHESNDKTPSFSLASIISLNHVNFATESNADTNYVRLKNQERALFRTYYLFLTYN